MAFGSGNNSNTSKSSGGHHHHHHHHSHSHSNTSTTSTSHQHLPPPPPQQQQSISNSQSNNTQKQCNRLSPSGGGGVPKTYYDGSSGGAGSSSSDTFQQAYQQPNHLFHYSNNNKSGGGGGKFQRFNSGGFVGGGGGDEGDGGFFGGDGGGSRAGGSLTREQQQQYNQAFHLAAVAAAAAGSGGGGGGGGGGMQQVGKDLTSQERAMLDEIRKRKAVLLQEIAQLQDEIDSVSRELLYSQKDDIVVPPPDLISSQQPPQRSSSTHHNHPQTTSSSPPDVPLADVELDNLSEHSEHDLQPQQSTTKIPSSTVLGSNSSTTSSNSSKEKDRLKIMSLGCKKFNMDPKKGIEFLVENGLLKKDDETDIGMFLYRGEGLNKTAIGDYLGERSPVNERVLKSFVGLHDFTDLILVQALRQFLWSFRLPGEAQKIDRMMECFAQRYCQNNPDIFTNTDTCYVLSFAIIMLNTSLHNPSVKDKPTVDTFISMNRGINNGGDLPRELLISLYNSIQSEPFKIPEDDGNDLMHTFFNPDKEGWLWKQGGRYKTWKRRWFILNDNCLYYFEFTTDKEPRGIIPLENVGVREIEDSGGSKSRQRYCFELYATDGSEVIKACKTDSDGRVVEGKHSVYRMSAANGEERDTWVKALRQSISYSPFYEILRKSGGGGTAGGGGGGNSSSSLRSGGGGGRLRE